MIHIEKLSFQYAPDEFHLYLESLHIPKEQRVALLGASGRGKSTLLNLIAGILLPQSGCISVNGNKLQRWTDAQRRDFRISKIGYVFQDLELVEYLNALENILLPFRINNSLVLNNAVIERAKNLSKQGRILDKLNQNITCLSRGERQRVVVCRALLSQPQLILADEPTGSLDPVNQEHILDMLCHHTTQHQATLLMVTHDNSHSERFDQILDLEALTGGENQ